jgi:hypothetical protein
MKMQKSDIVRGGVHVRAPTVSIEEAYKAGWKDGRVSASAYGPEPDWKRWKAREVSHD